MGEAAVGGATRKVLAAGTDRKSLIHEDPATLDASNLEVTPLESFETMGPTDRVIHLATWRLEVTGQVGTPVSCDGARERNPDIHVLLIPPGSDIEINALQRASAVVVQKSIREGFGLDGRAIFNLMPYQEFRRIPDEDVAAIVVYLRSLAPIRNPLPKSQLPFPLPLVMRGVPQPLEAPVPPPDLSTPEKRGEYVLRTSACHHCHTVMKNGTFEAALDMAGGRPFPSPQGTTAPAGQVSSTAALVAYLLLGLAALTQIAGSGLATPAPLLTIIGIIGVIVAYVKRDDARGTWLESHLTWLIGTFWWSTLWAVIGWLVLIALGGVPDAYCAQESESPYHGRARQICYNRELLGAAGCVLVPRDTS